MSHIGIKLRRSGSKGKTYFPVSFEYEVIELPGVHRKSIAFNRMGSVEAHV